MNLDLDVDPHLAQLVGDGLSDLAIVQITALRRVQGQLQAVGVAGLRQQLPRPFRIVGVRFDIHIVRVDDGQRPGHPRRKAAEDLVDDQVDIDGMVDRLAHAHVLHRPFVDLIQGDQDDAATRHRHDLAARGLDLRHKLRRNAQGQVDFTADDGRHARRRLGDGPELHPVDGRTAHEVVGIGLKDQALTRNPFDELERAGTHRIGGQVVGTVLPGIFRRDDVDDVEVQRQRRFGPAGLDAHRVLVDDLDRLHRLDVGQQLRVVGRVHDVVEGELDGLRVERLAVVEPHALTQADLPGEIIDQLVARCQPGDGLLLTVHEEERIIDVPQRTVGGGGVEHLGRVQALDVGRQGDTENGGLPATVAGCRAGSRSCGVLGRRAGTGRDQQPHDHHHDQERISFQGDQRCSLRCSQSSVDLCDARPTTYGRLPPPAAARLVAPGVALPMPYGVYNTHRAAPAGTPGAGCGAGKGELVAPWPTLSA